MRNKEMCKGCNTYESSKNEDVEGPAVCNHIPFVKNAKCPCSTCLIKSMCLKPCDNHTQYIQWLIKNHCHILDEVQVKRYKRWLQHDQ